MNFFYPKDDLDCGTNPKMKGGGPGRIEIGREQTKIFVKECSVERMKMHVELG